MENAKIKLGIKIFPSPFFLVSTHKRNPLSVENGVEEWCNNNLCGFTIVNLYEMMKRQKPIRKLQYEISANCEYNTYTYITIFERATFVIITIIFIVTIITHFHPILHFSLKFLSFSDSEFKNIHSQSILKRIYLHKKINIQKTINALQ